MLLKYVFLCQWRWNVVKSRSNKTKMLKMTKTKKTLTTKRKERKRVGYSNTRDGALYGRNRNGRHQIPRCICRNKHLLSRLETFLLVVLGRSIATGNNKLWNLRCMTSLSTLQSDNMSTRGRTAGVQRHCFSDLFCIFPVSWR